METLSAATPDDGSGANPSSVKSDDSSPPHESGRSSPPPNCAICLGTCRNKCFTDSCLHQFCFKCLLTWSKVKAECPLCKQNFKSIIHNVRSNHQYEEYMVEQRQTEGSPEQAGLDSLTTATRRFRYRTTLTLPRRETIAIQQLLLHYPMVAGVFPPSRAPPARRRRRSPASFRRTVYRHNLWARPLPDFTGRFRDCSPEFYRYNDSQMHRLVPWLNRELHYLLNENVGHISYVMARILELLQQYHINSAEFTEAMQRYFGDRTEHFLHELYCFASTPYDMTGYDRNVQYTTDTRISTIVNEVISSSESDASVDSDIVMVSSSGPAEPPPGPSRLPAPVYPQNFIPPPPTDNVIPIETISHSGTDDDSSEVMVVGYIKPPQDRTPEVVDLLGSDSDVIVQDGAPPEPEPSTSLVKLSLKRTPRRDLDTPDTDSDDSTYVPPTPPSRPRRKRRRSSVSRGSPSPATTAPSRSASPSLASAASPCARPVESPRERPIPSPGPRPATPPAPRPAPSPSPRALPPRTRHDTPPPPVTTDDSSTDSSDSYDRRRKTPKRSRRKTSRDHVERDKKRKRVASRSHKEKKSKLSQAEKNKRSKRKSHSGKGVKCSKKSESDNSATLERSETAQPGPSAAEPRAERECRRRRASRDTKRLKSVVNVMNGQKNSSDSSSSGNSNLLNILSSAILNPNSNVLAYNSDSGSAAGAAGSATGAESAALLQRAASCFRDASSDSEDDLPLNLSVHRTHAPL